MIRNRRLIIAQYHVSKVFYENLYSESCLKQYSKGSKKMSTDFCFTKVFTSNMCEMQLFNYRSNSRIVPKRQRGNGVMR